MMTEHSWGIETPGLEEAEAHALVRELQEKYRMTMVSAIDPRAFLTVSMPPELVAVLRRAVQLAKASVSSTDQDAVVFDNLDEMLAVWEWDRQK